MFEEDHGIRFGNVFLEYFSYIARTPKTYYSGNRAYGTHIFRIEIDTIIDRDLLKNHNIIVDDWEVMEISGYSNSNAKSKATKYVRENNIKFAFLTDPYASKCMLIFPKTFYLNGMFGYRTDIKFRDDDDTDVQILYHVNFENHRTWWEIYKLKGFPIKPFNIIERDCYVIDQAWKVKEIPGNVYEWGGARFLLPSSEFGWDVRELYMNIPGEPADTHKEYESYLRNAPARFVYSHLKEEK